MLNAERFYKLALGKGTKKEKGPITRAKTEKNKRKTQTDYIVRTKNTRNQLGTKESNRGPYLIQRRQR